MARKNLKSMNMRTPNPLMPGNPLAPSVPGLPGYLSSNLGDGLSNNSGIMGSSQL